MRFVLASENPGKIVEMRKLLSVPGIEIVSRKELDIDMVVDETGGTFYENALIKAKAICNASRLPAIADDSGLEVDALGGNPGVYTSSFGGEGLDDSERCDFLLDKLRDTEHRNAKFVCYIVCVFPDGEIISSNGECKGVIAKAPRGAGGFGYDPVFIAEGMDATMAELDEEIKNRISHRGKALESFVRIIESKATPG